AVAFQQFPAAAQLLENMVRTHPAVGAREILGTNLRALYAGEVIGEIEETGLRYAGNGLVVANLLDLAIPPQLRASAEALPVGAAREVFLDFARNTDARVDLYIRPAAEPREPAEALADFLIRRAETSPETLRRQQLAQNTGIDFTAQLYT